MAEFQEQLEAVLSDRRSPEAAALFETLLKYVHKKVAFYAHKNGRDLLSNGDVEEISGEILLQLMSGGLQRFNGESLPELLGFCRTMCRRITWRAIHSRRRERDALQDAGTTHMDRWTGSVRRTGEDTEYDTESPLSEKDKTYLVQLLEAGSKAELSRRAGVSRAAVTQRVQRIRKRIDALSEDDRMRHEVWIRQAAHQVLS